MDEQAAAQLAVERERLRLEQQRLRLERSRLAAELRQLRQSRAAPPPAVLQRSLRELLGNPLLLAIVGGSLTLLTAVATNYLSGKANREADERRAQHARDTESRTLQSELIKSFVSTGNSANARDNLGFLIDSGLIPDHEARIKRYLADRSKPTPKLESQTAGGSRGNASTQGAAPCPKLELTRAAPDAALRLSLHIGANRVDPAGYGGWDGELRGPVHDAHAMARLAGALGYQSFRWLDGQTRSACLIPALTQVLAAARSGDRILLSYSGHGGQQPDKSGTEPDKLTEAWVLYDRMLPSTELLELLRRAPAGVTLTLVQDSDNVSSLPIAAGAKPLAATVIVLAGAREGQHAMDGGKQGAFTEALLAVWDEGRFQGSYEALVKAVAARMPATQQPQLHVRGPDPKAGQKPAFR